MDRKPVFRDKFEASLWKRLTNDPGQSKRAEHYIGVANSVIKHDGTISSAILTKLIESLYEIRANDFVEISNALLAKCRSNDCTPRLTLASMYVDMDMVDRAEVLVNEVRQGQNIPLISCVKAKIRIKRGDPAGAKKELMRARCSDPTYPLFYDLIKQIEPSEGWEHRRNIELLALGLGPIQCEETGTTSAEVLYRIYKEWYRGDRDRATSLMIGSEEYKKKNSEYVLASARISMDEGDWHSAQRMYRALLSKSTNCIYIICEAAKAFYMGSDGDRALALYRDAEALDPASPMVIKGLIRTYSSRGMHEEAAQCILMFFNTENAYLDFYLEGAEILITASMYSDAVTVLDRVLISYPSDVKALILKSEAQRLNGNVNGAMVTILNAADGNPDDADVRLQKARLLFDTGKTDKAVKELSKAKSLGLDNVKVLEYCMGMAFNDKDTDEVMKLGKRILELEPGNVGAMNMISKASLIGKDEESYVKYKNMVLDDNRAENVINILYSLMAEERYDDVLKLCEEKDREYGKVPMVRRLRGNAEYHLGNYAAASTSFAFVAGAEPLDPVIWHSKGMADEGKGDLDRAEEAYNRAVLLDMDEPEYWISRSSIQDKKGDMEGAVGSLNKAIGLRPDNVSALVRKGMLFAKAKRFEESIYFMDMALHTDPGNLKILRMLRDVCFTSGDHMRAEECARMILAKDSADRGAVEAAIKILSASGKSSDAARLIDDSLGRDPNSIPLLIIKKEFNTFIGNNIEVIDACKRILNIQPDNDGIRTDLAEAYAATGDMGSANRMYLELKEKGNDVKEVQRVESKIVHAEYRKKTPDKIKRYSERVLRRAYISQFSLGDPDLMDAVDIDRQTVKEVMDYLGNIEEYGDIVPGTPEFERMERLSLNAIIKGGHDDLENDPVISIPCAYVAGGASDADEAKRLVAYVYKAMTVRVNTKSIPPELRKMAIGISKGTIVSEIMKKLKLGVYQARLIKSLL